MKQNYDMMIREKAERVFGVMEKRVSAQDVERIRAAFELAKTAHADQKRKSGEPYIFHPIAVANIVAEELMLGANPVIAAFPSRKKSTTRCQGRWTTTSRCSTPSTTTFAHCW